MPLPVQGVDLHAELQEFFRKHYKASQRWTARGNHQNIGWYMGVSKKWWYPRIIHFNRVFHVNHPFWGTPIFERPIYIYIYIRMITDENCLARFEACRMRLCIFGIEDLDALETAVSNSFGAVSSRISSGAIGFCGRRSTFQREGLKIELVDWTLVDFRLSWYVVVGPR